MPTAPIGKLAILRADGDLYESTMDVLVNLHHKVSSGGFVILDDYFSWEGCRRAATDFRNKHGVDAEIIRIDGSSAYWRVQ